MLVVGAGVAGLAAIAQAKAMGAVVRAYDVRPVVREQIESLGAEFLQVEYEEDGSGAGGYAKEMSDGWKEVGTGGVRGMRMRTGSWGEGGGVKRFDFSWVHVCVCACLFFFVGYVFSNPKETAVVS